MKLDMFDMQINEARVGNKMGDMGRRVAELRALNNSADMICKKVAKEFGKGYDEVKKYLLPMDLKKYVGMTSDKLDKVGLDTIKSLSAKYRKHAPADTRNRARFIKQLMNSLIQQGR